MNNNKWPQSVRSLALSSVLRKFDQVSLGTFVVDLIWRYGNTFTKSGDLQMVEWVSEEHCLKQKECLNNLKDVVVVEEVQKEKDIDNFARDTECPMDDLHQSLNSNPEIQNISPSIRVSDWTPVVNLSDRLKPLECLKLVSVKLVDVFQPHKKNSLVRISVKSNFGVDETIVYVSKSILEEYPKILNKCVVNVEDVLVRKLNQIPPKEKFMSSLKLQHVDSSSNHFANGDATQKAKFLRSQTLSNVPWSSELGLLLRKQMDVRPLSRIERNERFLNRSDTPTIRSKTYPITYSKPSPGKCHTYTFGSRRNSTKSVELAKRKIENGVMINGNVSSNFKGCAFSMKDVRVVVTEEEQKAVRDYISLSLKRK